MAQRYFNFLNLTRRYLQSLGAQAVGLPSYGVQQLWDNWFRALTPRGNISATLPARNVTAYYPNDPSAISLDGSNNVILWADMSGNSTTNAFVSGGVDGNTATTPNASVTGSLTITFDVLLADYTPSVAHRLLSKASGNNGFEIFLKADGTFQFFVGDGTSITTVESTVPVGVTDLTRCTLSVVWTDGVGATFRVNGVQLGAPVAAAKTLTNAATTATIGRFVNGVIYSVTVGSVYNFQPSVAAKLATSFVAPTTGETWTINTTGDTGARISGERDLYQGTAANRPAYTAAIGNNRLFMTFDGTNDYLKAVSFTLSQPESVYFVGQQITWTSFDYLFDGNISDGGSVVQFSSSPTLIGSAGGAGTGQSSQLPLGRVGIVTVVFNQAASLLRVNRFNPNVGNSGTNNMLGFTVASKANASSFGNISAQEIVIYAEAHTTGIQNQIVNYFASKYGISL